jgi:hypothetical protein
MKNLLAFGVFAVAGLWLAQSVVLAFTEPAQPPPQGNVPPPITVGPGRQSKAGDITVQNLKASSITLGEDTRTTWLDALGACAWEGWKCDCQNNNSSGSSVALTVGIQCQGGQLRDMRIVDLQISSKTKSCPSKAPAPCAASLYKYKNDKAADGDKWYDPFGWW